MIEKNNTNLILNEVIKIIPSNGINNDTLLKACINLKLKNNFCKFEDGIYTALKYIVKNFNNSMVTELTNFDIKNMKIHQRAKLAIEIHLLNYAKLPNYRKFLKNLLLFSILPNNIYFSNKLLYEIINTICYSIYDKSVDFNCCK